MTPRALVRPPVPSLADGLLTHLKRVPVDFALAREQWQRYVSALEDAGFATIEVPAAGDHPDSVFVEDTVVMLGTTAVLASPGAPSRGGEVAAVEKCLADLGVPIARIQFPGTLDGGDVLKIGTTVYIGVGGRTNEEGARQLGLTASELGYAVTTVPVTRVLHLKSAVTALPDGTVIGFPPLVEHPELFENFRPVPEAAGSAVVVLSDDSVLMSASAPESAAVFQELGYRVISVDITEFEKLEGCVTCLSVRMR